MANDSVLDRLQQTGIRTDDDMVDLVGSLLERAHRRQCWLLFLEEDGLPVRLLIPVEDLPYEPDDGDGDVLASMATEVIAVTSAAQLLIAWERPGASRMYPVDWAWVHEVEGALASAGVPLLGQVLVHADGADVLHLDGPEAA